MCGIAGILSSDPLATPEAIAAAMAHRGPDDHGSWSTSHPHGLSVWLGHRRLAIQDLSASGHQPMASACGRWRLVFNGEIYNQHAIRRDLEHQGHCFLSSSDTEVLLQLLIRHGPRALTQLRGMYAFCLWDNQEQQALLARDPFGIKPLYLWHGPKGTLLFASEVRALLASGLIPRRLDAHALAGFLSSGSVPAPLTLVQGVTSLPAGWYGHWQAGRWQVYPHWQPSYRSESPAPCVPIQATRSALEATVQAHLVADVPVGLFLSGGLDSSALLALAGGADLTTLSIGFGEEAFDESGRAAVLARHFGSHHVPLQLDAPRAAALLPAFLAAVDQPSIDGFNTFCVSQLAHEQGLKVVLSGLGGDELFGGYPSFRKIPRLLQLHQSLGPARRALAAILARSPQHQRQRLAAFLQGPGTPVAAHRCLRGLFAPAEVTAILQAWGISEPASPSGEDPEAALSGDPRPHTAAFPQLADAIAWLETSRYMGQQLLRDSDTFSMAHGLELRLPLVDAQLFSEMRAIPAAVRLARGKHLLDQAVPELRQALPPESKRGFTFPFGQWFDQPDSSLRPGNPTHPLPHLPSGIDLAPWPRRWGLMVLRHWLQQHLDLELG